MNIVKCELSIHAKCDAKWHIEFGAKMIKKNTHNQQIYNKYIYTNKL